jgi:excisionase family DNA binding protein
MCDLTSISYLTIREVSQQLHLSRSKVYDLVAREGLPVAHFGRAVRVPAAALEQWLFQRAQAQMEEIEPSASLSLSERAPLGRLEAARTRRSPSFPAKSYHPSGSERSAHGIIRPALTAREKGANR